MLTPSAVQNCSFFPVTTCCTVCTLCCSVNWKRSPSGLEVRDHSPKATHAITPSRTLNEVASDILLSHSSQMLLDKVASVLSPSRFVSNGISTNPDTHPLGTKNLPRRKCQIVTYDGAHFAPGIGCVLFSLTDEAKHTGNSRHGVGES